MPDEMTFELASVEPVVSAMNGSNCAHSLVLET